MTLNQIADKLGLTLLNRLPAPWHELARAKSGDAGFPTST